MSEVTNLAPELLDCAARVVQGELKQVEPLYVAAESWAKKVGVRVSQYFKQGANDQLHIFYLSWISRGLVMD